MPSRQPFALRTEKLDAADANLLQDVHLDDQSLDTLPDQLRASIHKRRVRIVDIFRQFDDNRVRSSACALDLFHPLSLTTMRLWCPPPTGWQDHGGRVRQGDA